MVPKWTSKYIAHRDDIGSLRSDQQGDSLYNIMASGCIFASLCHRKFKFAFNSLSSLTARLPGCQVTKEPPSL